ncbi:hypothetical protein OWV82_008860 [Melia azedarach]|uniref:Uncharacterized protein n=1 Tax=Melia azedarach TaxID=155640 RepID=A0ACC1YCX8_MELAZ|nr:hypothetical protein OWV82_008860 [Melia azedarach]
MEISKPKQVQNYPENGVLNYLFRKKLKQTDMKTLLLVKESTAYFEGLPESIKAEMDAGNFQVVVYTANSDPIGVFIKRDVKEQPSEFQAKYHLKQATWFAIPSLNGFEVGDEIDCWAVYNPDIEPCLSLVIEKFAN